MSTLTLVPFAALAPEAEAASGTAISAVKAALAGRFEEAGQLAKSSNDPSAIKLVELLYLRDNGRSADYQRIVAFLEDSPKWPSAETLNRRAEQALYENQNSSLTLEHFAERKPTTAKGHIAHARALADAGQGAKAKEALLNAWLNADVDASFEGSMLSEFGGSLTDANRRARLWRLIYAQEATAATRLAGRLGKSYTTIARVAQALLRSEGGASKKYDALPSAQRNLPALRYALARYYRKQEKYAKARAVLLAAPATAAEMGDPEAWWTERRILARRSVGPNNKAHWSDAYKIASRHGLTSGNDAIEAEFLSGWIALRYLNKPSAAIQHFNQLKSIATSRTEQARADYWLGRTYLALGEKSDANAAFKAASKHTTVYYGQLARVHIGLGKVPEEIETTDTSSRARQKVDRDEVIRAFRLMSQAGGKGQLHQFLWPLSTRFDSADEMNAAATIVHGVGGTTMALRFAKAASVRGIDIDAWAYPLKGLPNWKSIGPPIEKSLVFALSRQESEFDPQAGSRVGAQGLMQLMPGTAKIIARQYGLPYVQSKLKGDPSYNVKLGAAHLGDLVSDFGGSYVLTLIAYNAGPGRAKEWLADYGDIRSGAVDPIDWVECIPFQETRQYVQKVLQNLHIYRSRLSPEDVAPMTADLSRGAPKEITVASTSAPPEKECGGKSIVELIFGCE